MGYNSLPIILFWRGGEGGRKKLQLCLNMQDIKIS